ncbi:hypothetical protein OG21DRAFT_1483220 [Imleria badia]|nr:hypothetical protein OG21DRAFT_1483220 [Imleria badia]
MWPVKVQRQFDIAQAAGNDALENVLHAPYNKLLNTLFPVDTDFTVIPNFQEINSTKGADYLVTFKIFLENRPIFVLQLKREKDFSVRSKRTAADDQLRGRLGDLIDACPLPAGLVLPESIPASPQYVIDTAPVDRWNYDILADEGEAELRRIVQAITTECAQLPQ